MSNFTEGQEVVCISTSFSYIEEYGGTGGAKDKPKLGERLCIDEVLGDFLRFGKYDTEESFNWWKSDRFVPVDLKGLEELLEGIENKKVKLEKDE